MKYPIHFLSLPANCMMPTAGGEVTENVLFKPPFPLPANENEELGLSTWILSHQVFFMSLNVATFAAHQAIKDKKWIERLIILRLGMVAYIGAAANLTKELYESYIRPAMRSMRSDFSGVSSIDNWEFDIAIKQLANIQDYDSADKMWWDYHTKIMGKLVSKPQSLAQIEYKRQMYAGSFEDFKKVLRSPQALIENDRFFAVGRGTVSLPQFKHNFLQAISKAKDFQDNKLSTYWENATQLIMDIFDEY
jgi:hypothetical protein